MPASEMIITATFKLDGGGTALDNAEAEAQAVKVVENGMVIINYNGKRFNVLGQAIR